MAQRLGQALAAVRCLFAAILLVALERFSEDAGNTRGSYCVTVVFFSCKDNTLNV